MSKRDKKYNVWKSHIKAKKAWIVIQRSKKEIKNDLLEFI